MTAAPARFAPNPGRRAMLAKVHLARKELGLNEADYRAVLARVTGVSSAAVMTSEQLHAALSEFRRLGWQQKSSDRTRVSGRSPQSGPAGRASRESAGDAGASRQPRPADHPAAKKARSLWISLAQLGVVRNSGEQALEAFARRQLGVERLQWADQAQVYKLTEALKAMAERAGWSQAGLTPGFEAPELVQRLIRRLDELLHEVEPAAPTLGQRTRAPGCFIGGWERADMGTLYGLAGQLGRELAAARAKAEKA